MFKESSREPWKNLRNGTILATLSRKISALDLALYSAATWDFHRIHYDDQFAKSVGLKTAIMDGQMLGSLVAKMIDSWLKGNCEIKKLSTTYRKMVFAGDSLKIGGRVRSVNRVRGATYVNCDIWIKNQKNENIIENGSATIRLERKEK